MTFLSGSLLIGLFLLVTVSAAYPHSGSLDSYGCTTTGSVAITTATGDGFQANNFSSKQEMLWQFKAEAPLGSRSIKSPSQLSQRRLLSKPPVALLSATSSTRRSEPKQADVIGKPMERTAASERPYEVVYDTLVYSEPRVDSSIVARIEAGTRVNVVDVRGDWLEVRSKHGRPPGFIKKDSAIAIRVRQKSASEQQGWAEKSEAKARRDVAVVRYEDISNAYKTMTDVQFKAYVKGLRGIEMEGKGWVKNVGEKYEITPWGTKPSKGISKVLLYVEGSPRGRYGVVKDQTADYDVLVEVPESMGFELNLGQFVTFRGQIRDVSCQRGGFCSVGLEKGLVAGKK